MAEIDWYILINIIQNLGYFLGVTLLFYAIHVHGRFYQYRKQVCLSQICPELDNMESETNEEKEENELRQKLAQAAGAS